MSYTHLNRTERNVIYRMRFLNHSLSEIARTLGRHKSTISRELRRNRTFLGKWWSSQADMYAGLAQRRHLGRPKTGDRRVMRYVLQRLEQGWSPEQIAGRIRQVDFPEDPTMWISHETIYRYVWADKARGGSLFEHLRRGKKRYRKRGRNTQTRGQIRDRVSIEERPKEVEDRCRFGDWEGDTVVGKNMKGYIATFVERKSRFTVARVMKDKRAQTLNTAAFRGFAKLPSNLIRTLTVDNGKEFAGFKEIERRLSTHVYFAHPYSSWERGTNENTNGLLRQYIPKKTEITDVTPAALNAIIKRINNRPRKTLKYRTPHEVFQDAIVALHC